MALEHFGGSMNNHEDLKSELASIAKIVNSFPDEVRSKVFDLLVASYLGKNPVMATPVTTPPTDDKPPARAGRKSSHKRAKSVATTQATGSESPSTKKSSKKSGSKESWEIDRELDLRANSTAPSFKDFVAEKQPKNESEFWAVSAYYLKKQRGIAPVTLGHIYTCYAEVKRKPPTAFRQILTNTKNRHGWIEPDEQGNINIPHRGVVYVEHDLPASEKPKK
jgi:hypothetical protein